MKPLNIDELSIPQKIGQLLIARTPTMLDSDDAEFALTLIRDHALGGVQVAPNADAHKIISRIQQAADYPIFIAADMETGFPLGELQIACPLSLGVVNDPQCVYDFAKITAIQAKQFGYNMIWSPIVDTATRDSLLDVLRSFGENKEHVAELSISFMKAFSDCGIIGAAKHYPSIRDDGSDSHMLEKVSYHTREELLSENLYPYRQMIQQLGSSMTGVMTSHARMLNIDPEFPATLSKPCINILRNDLGFDGLVITDSLAMMGIIQKYGDANAPALAVAAGNDLVLPNYRVTLRDTYHAMRSAFEHGLFPEDRLNEACARVIRGQGRTLVQPAQKEISAHDREVIARINRECVCAVTNPDHPVRIDRDKRHLFVVLKCNIYDSNDLDVNFEIEFDKSWDPQHLADLLLDKFPHSDVEFICEFPHRDQNERVCAAAAAHDDVVFVTFCDANAYQGSNGLTERVRYLIASMSYKIAAIVHVGNPYALEQIVHVPRYIFALPHKSCIETIPAILSGEDPVKGSLPLNLKLQDASNR